MYYAAMHDVTPILNAHIDSIRDWIEPMMHEIYFNHQSQSFFGDDFQNFVKIIDHMKGSNLIGSNHNHNPFLVNVRYSKLEVLEKPVVCELTPNNVNQWKIQVDMPGNCTNI